MKNKKIVIMIPTKGTMKTRTTESLLRCFQDFVNERLNFKVIFSEGTLLTHVRNALITSALKEEASHFMFIDSDMVFDPKWIIEMIKKDLDFISGVARCRGNKRLNVMKFVPSVNMYDSLKVEDIKEELVEIDSAGMSFFLMKKEAVEKMRKDKQLLQQYFNTKSSEISSPNLKKYYQTLANDEGFFRSIGTKSEDVLFCEEIKNAGFKIYAYTPAKLGHIVEEQINV